MSKGGDGQLIGYWYGAGMHMVVCHSVGDAIVARIMVGDKIAWSGNVTVNGTISINQPDLFGGESREGGIVGAVDVLLGSADQPCNDYLVDKCGGGPPAVDTNTPPLANGLYTGSDGKVYLPDGTPLTGYTLPAASAGGPGVSGFVPAFRGVLSFVLRRVWLAAMNPYIKPWSFLVRRYPGTLGPSLSKIGTDANPAAIIAEALINTEWGRGYNTSDLDVVSFTTAATTLAAEDFGMSLTWTQQQTIDDFISHVLATIDAYRYTDPTTGLVGIRLVRADYDVDDLIVLDDTNILSMQQFARPDPSDIINQVTINFTERPSYAEQDDDGNPTGYTILKNVDRSITVHNGASIELTGSVNPTTIDYPGISNVGIAARVAMRELAAKTRGLASVKLVANRAAAQLKAGDVCKFTWPPLGIVDMVIRLTEVDYGLLTDGRITVTGVEDAFSLPTTTYLGAANSAWTEPIENVKQIANALLIEAPYYVVAQTAGDNDAVIDGFPPGYGFLAVAAARQQNQATSYGIWQKSSGQYVQDGNGGYTAYGTLTADIDDSVTSFNVAWGDLTNYVPNTYAILGTEWVWISGINNTTVTVIRAIFDTVPVRHVAGETLWMAGGMIALDQQTTFLAGQTVPVKLQPRTPSQVMALSAATERTITFIGRADRPYPPGNLMINGIYRPKQVMGPGLVLSWSPRNRLTQTAGPVSQTDPGVTAEAGTTYSVVLKQRTDSSAVWSTVESASGITGLSYTATGPWGDTLLRFELTAVRDGLSSYQTQILEFEMAGYGIGYGNYYGGFSA